MKAVITIEAPKPEGFVNLLVLLLMTLQDGDTLAKADKGEPVEIALPAGKATIVMSEME